MATIFARSDYTVESPAVLASGSGNRLPITKTSRSKVVSVVIKDATQDTTWSDSWDAIFVFAANSVDLDDINRPNGSGRGIYEYEGVKYYYYGCGTCLQYGGGYITNSATPVILNNKEINYFTPNKESLTAAGFEYIKQHTNMRITGESEPFNPYSPGGTTGPGGGNGSFSPTSDPIDFPTLPTFGALNAGFVSIWTPDEKQVQDLAGYMWTTDIFTSAFWKNLVQNPLELIFGLSIMPIQRGSNDEYVRLGWINTGLKMYYRDNQYYEVDCGSINMQEYWGAFFDYSPYTKISIYLPYIGVKDLDTNDLMGRLVSLKYIIDLATGTCVAMIKCDDSVYYHFSGVCAVQIPVTAVQMQEVVKGAVTAAVGVAAVATAPALAASAAGAMAAQVGGAASAISGVYQHATGKDVARSGSFTGNAGFMSVQKPYLIISRPRQAMPEDQQVYTGFPSFMTKKLSEVSGYTEVQMIHLHNLSCTDDERAEIDELLKEGVIF